MQLRKYKITTPTAPGYMMVIYHDDNFKSVLNEFKPPLNEKQLNALLNFIPNDPLTIEAIFIAKYGDRVKVEPVHAIGAEPVQQMPEVAAYATNDKIALFCSLYAASHKDADGSPVKYKTGAAEAGKIKALAVTPDELELLLEVYFKSQEWYLKPKSISNFIKKFNEVRALAYTKATVKVRTFPLPFDAIYFGNLSTMDQRMYWEYLRENGYHWEAHPGRGGKWIKNTI